MRGRYAFDISNPHCRIRCNRPVRYSACFAVWQRAVYMVRAEHFTDADYKKPISTLDAIDNLLQCAATDFAGMDYPSLKKLGKESALPVSEVLAAYGRVEQAKEALLRVEVPLDSEQE